MNIQIEKMHDRQFKNTGGWLVTNFKETQSQVFVNILFSILKTHGKNVLYNYLKLNKK